MKKTIIEEIYKNLDSENKIRMKQINKKCNKFPKIKLENIPIKMKRKLTDRIIKEYEYKKIQKEGKDNENNKILLEKAKEGEIEVVKYLVSLGGDIHAYNDGALRWSAENGHLDVVKYLVSLGADINVEEGYVLRWSAHNGHLEVVEYLISQGAEIDACDNCALKWSAEYGQIEVVKYLVSQGADIYAEFDEALRKSAATGHLNVVKYLVKEGAKIERVLEYPPFYDLDQNIREYLEKKLKK